MSRKEELLALAAFLALAGCGDHEELNARRAEWEYEKAYRNCINGAVGWFSAASIEVVKHCETKARALAATEQ